MKLLLATTNLNKVREVTPLLEHLNGIEWLTLSDIPPIVEPPESSETYWENAREKALAYAGGTTSEPTSTFASDLLVLTMRILTLQ